MLLSEFDYDLPEELIAQSPLPDRSASRLLYLNKATGETSHLKFREAIHLFRPGDVLVLNTTRVTALRLFGNRHSGGKVELLLLKEISYGVFEALANPAKRLKIGSEIFFDEGLVGKVIKDGEAGCRMIDFSQNLNWKEVIESIGRVPLPPYIHEPLAEKERYQTVYGSESGSSAAPTAGLHFTQELLAEFQSAGVRIANVTLDVGIDTFRPVQSETLEGHKMHGEVCRIDSENAEIINSASGRIVAVGTTSVRTLESFATGKRKVASGEKSTQIFIKPGYEFQCVDAMFTNFHLPRTTMLMMISALASRETVFAAYHEAIREKYRFLSFGDSMLIF